MNEEQFLLVIQWIVIAIELVGVGVIVLGALIAIGRYLRGLAVPSAEDGGVACLRSDLGRGILLGLEFLVAADIINTVAIEPTLESVAVLGGVVLIRTFLSFSLEVEIDGRWPWRKKEGRAG